MYTNEVLIFYRIHKNSNRELIYIACKSFNLINTHLHLLNLDTLIYLRELGDLAKSNLVIQLPAILSRMPLPEANLGNTLGLFTLNTIFIIIRFTRRILNCISSNRRENHAHASPVSRPPLTEDPILVAPPESQGSLFLLSIHVHFLIITYIHISCIFSELVSQCASVRMTQFFYILTYSIQVKVYCYCLTLNCYCLTITVQLLLSKH